jgi:threonine dehydrogenase-like Zn-dependent dehydrogenase
MSILGFHRDGGLAEWVEVREHNLLPLPDGLDTRVATLAEPLACAINGLDQLRLTQGQRLVIHGAGPLGLLLAFAAHDRGLEAVLVERDEKKGHLSKSFREAAGLPLHRPGDVALPRGTFDGAINATSNPTAVAEGLTALRPAGRYCLFSGLSHDANTTNLLNEFHYRQLEMTGAYGCTRAQMSQALALLARKERLLALLLHRRLDLAEAPVALAEVVAGQALRYVVGVEPRS